MRIGLILHCDVGGLRGGENWRNPIENCTRCVFGRGRRGVRENEESALKLLVLYVISWKRPLKIGQKKWQRWSFETRYNPDFFKTSRASVAKIRRFSGFRWFKRFSVVLGWCRGWCKGCREQFPKFGWQFPKFCRVIGWQFPKLSTEISDSFSDSFQIPFCWENAWRSKTVKLSNCQPFFL